MASKYATPHLIANILMKNLQFVKDAQWIA